MKKTLLLVFVCAALVACGKDYPIDSVALTPKTAPDQPKESEQPDPVLIVTKEDIITYFGFGYEDVNINIARTKTLIGVQKIDEKNIEVTKVEVNNKDEKSGSFVLHLEGKVNGKAFETTLTFDGFTKRPEDYRMGKRVQGEWKTEANKYTKFDLDYLLREKKTDKFTAQYLSEVIDFYSSDLDGKPFYYTEEDIKKSVISDMKYNSHNGGEISFNLIYNGIKSESLIRLDMNKDTYYAEKVTVNTDFFKKMYVRGVAENYSIFGGNAVEYNEDLYAVQCVLASDASESAGKLSFNFKLMPAHGDGEALAYFSKAVDGFKPLKELKDELLPQFTTEVQEVMKKYVNISTPDGDVKEKIKAPIANWIKKISFSIKRDNQYYDITWDENFTVLRGWDVKVMDVYLEHPKFELLSAHLKDDGRKMLYLGIKLVYANEILLNDDDIVLTLPIHISK